MGLWPVLEGPCPGLSSAVTALKFLTHVFLIKGPLFHFALGPANYVTAPANAIRRVEHVTVLLKKPEGHTGGRAGTRLGFHVNLELPSPKSEVLSTELPSPGKALNV